LFAAAQALHTNFYENWLATDAVEVYLNNVKTPLPELERARTGPPPSSIADPNREQRNHWRRLTRG
jgi:hypothetical protein